MSDSRLTTRFRSGSMSFKGGPDLVVRRPPRLVLGGAAFAARVADHFRGLGWEVVTAADACEARRLAARKRPAAVLLPAEGDDESGYLTCAKIKSANPRQRVVIVAEDRTPEAARLAGFVGAAFAVEATVADEVARVVKA